MRITRSLTLALAVLSLGALVGRADAGVIDNDVPAGTVGHLSVNVTNGGESRDADITGNGAISGVTTTEVIFDYFSYVDVGNNGGAFRLGNGTSATVSGNDTATSSGSFVGSAQNTIDWTVSSSIPDLGSTMTSIFTFTARTGTLGVFRFIQYLDEDVLGVSDDFLFTRGSAAGGDLELFTIDGDEGIGVSHGGAYSGAQGLVNSAFVGWAADEFADLRSAITGAGASYSPTGVVDTSSLPPSINALVGAGWGEEDITSALAWDVFANATSATIITTLGGVPDARQIPPVVPLPPAAWMGLALLGGIGLVRRSRRRS